MRKFLLVFFLGGVIGLAAGFNSVVIWCEAFGVLISPATLTFPAS